MTLPQQPVQRTRDVIKSVVAMTDHQMNLIEPEAISDAEFEKFHTTLKEMLEFIKYSTNPDKLISLVESDEVFQHLGQAEMAVLI